MIKIIPDIHGLELIKNRMKIIKFFFLIFLLAFVKSSVEAHPSWGIVVDKDRNIYFADLMHNGRGSVWKLTSKGKLELIFQDFHAHNVSLDKNYNLVTADGEMDRHIMVRFNQDASIDTLIHANDYKVFNGGCCTYTQKDEIVFSAEHYLWRLDENGERKKISDHYFEWNQTVYADENGYYFAPDIGDGKGKLIQIDSNGVATIIARNLITKSNRPYDKHADVLMGITRGCDQNMYIAELAGQRIIKIEDDGKTETFYTSSGDWIPTGLDFFAGDAYILEYKEKNGQEGPRIIKVDEFGNTSVLFNFDTYQNKAPAPPGKSNGIKRSSFKLLFIGIGLFILALGILKIKNSY